MRVMLFRVHTGLVPSGMMEAGSYCVLDAQRFLGSGEESRSKRV